MYERACTPRDNVERRDIVLELLEEYLESFLYYFLHSLFDRLCVHDIEERLTQPRLAAGRSLADARREERNREG